MCSGTCKKFRVLKPHGESRYGSGQCHCQICDTWMDHNGCHLQDGSIATTDSDGWYCNCCNYKVRRKPRNIEYKEKIRSHTHSKKTDEDDSVYEQKRIDLSYFNKRRALMMKKIAMCILKKEEEEHQYSIHDYLMLDANISNSDIEHEFNTSLMRIVELADVLDPPNKMSMILEFERVRSLIGNVPTKSEFEMHSKLQSSQYDIEFQSWEHMLERLGYDPFYVDNNTKPDEKQTKEPTSPTHVEFIEEQPAKSLEEIKDEIQNKLKDEPDMLKLFNILDEKITKCDKTALEKIIDNLD